MEKDNQAKVGRTKCDLCDKTSAQVVGDRLLCADHASMAKNAAAEVPLKDAGLAFRDHHR
jgi:hypothetical protein